MCQCGRDTANMYPERATCIRQHVSVNMYVSEYKLLVRDTLLLLLLLLLMMKRLE